MYHKLYLLLAAQKQTILLLVALLVIGVIQDIREIAEIAEMAKRHKAYMHTDAVQALGKIPVNFAELNADLNNRAMTI